MSNAERVKCELKGHDLREEKGVTKCFTCNEIIEDRSLPERIRYEILTTENKVFDFFTVGMLFMSALPLLGFIPPTVSLFYREKLEKESNTIIHYGFILAMISNLILFWSL